MKNNFNISELFDADYIVDLGKCTKKEALDTMLELICKNELITDCKKFKKSIHDREKLMSTGIGYGIAIPHARHSSVKDFVIAVGRSREGIEYESIDDNPVHLIFMIGASDKQDKDYIKLLSKLVLRLKNKDIYDNLLKADTAQEVYEIFQSRD